ncbi:nitrate/nitrite transporter [Psychromonas sp. SR45-3]|uniref:MFS transporter n=1 Tax=Psychromonas sp. SR45-3 TaxID=2760930 RepID=UPI0015FD303F|nr:MFS transporter [Psychromonas sp. SR45-3]MBB1272167.1 MFS transporter [Psychromonas sp. SR45-3]
MSDTTLNTVVGIPASLKGNISRYFQFILLLLASGAIYPLLYLRQNFEVSILETFNITITELGNYYSLLGVMFMVCYVPSGWLADRIPPRLLITFSMAMTGGLGMLFATVPSKEILLYIFLGWGIASGLTFWASLLKGVKMLAGKGQQGRFFGILDGGRGLVEAILATIAISIFAYSIESNGETTAVAIKQVIHMYSYTCLGLAVVIFLFLKDAKKTEKVKKLKSTDNLWSNLKFLASIPEMWLVATVIFCGYQLFWATYSFSAYLQESYEISAVTAGFITVAKLWMRPIGGIGGGFLGDKFRNENILAISLLGASLFLLGMVLLPQLQSITFVLIIVLIIGVLTYAIRGLYWAILDDCDIPMNVTGLAIGVISLIAYTPDIFLPMLNGYIAERYEGLTVYHLYFSYIAIVGILGAVACLKLRNLNDKKQGIQS